MILFSRYCESFDLFRKVCEEFFNSPRQCQHERYSLIAENLGITGR